ncbi:MAG: hypothetical protein R3F48_06800 [Candidatus Zixiibacteriota bacterium]
MFKKIVHTFLLALLLWTQGVCGNDEKCGGTLIKISDTSGSMYDDQFAAATRIRADILDKQAKIFGLQSIEVILVNDALSVYTPETTICSLTCATEDIAESNVQQVMQIQFGVEYLRAKEEELKRLRAIRKKDIDKAKDVIGSVKQSKTLKTSVYGFLSLLNEIWDPECQYEVLTDLKNDYPYDSSLAAKLRSHNWDNTVIVLIPSQGDIKEGTNIEEILEGRKKQVEDMMPGVKILSPVALRRYWDGFASDEKEDNGNNSIKGQSIFGNSRI